MRERIKMRMPTLFDFCRPEEDKDWPNQRFGIPVLTVEEVTSLIKRLIDGDPTLQRVWVRGEISNLRYHSSGHIYFTLKDEKSSIRCVLFRGNASRLKFRMEEGMGVLALGRVGVYEINGSYQLYVEEVEPDGIGALYLSFQQLKEKLKREGLFDDRFKKPLPAFPSKIGIITSPSGAAIRDMIKILSRRWRGLEILVAPVRVQGDGAAEEIADAIRMMNEDGNLDIIILGRGGGSIEDLWAFNEEIVARAIFESKIPVISAVGHETDFTIADFVADKRAATPSAAAEIAVPDRMEVIQTIESLEMRIRSRIIQIVKEQRRRLEHARSMVVSRSPMDQINQRRQRIDDLIRTITRSLEHRIKINKKILIGLMEKIDALSPLSVLSRGYTLTYSLPDRNILKRCAEVSPEEEVEVRFADGRLICEVKERKKDEIPGSFLRDTRRLSEVNDR
ncbi:MAG: exodeoxyribonuclease VII large subunit [Candidatus Syntrophoarchaeum butanivorans]|uniref:Exodeoxyribonuclease VII large subunit n=2 Tax=Candidatus Syntropharchaeum butanivorans TaxID=1839936 RepID=A0A1F2P5R1_9EURY|nr:MAG: exodeoxyribonuclease VII large subunit [Candidatus Syntrophoarchaeum butanivorans]